MGQYAAPLRDMQFVLHELLNVEDEVRQMPKHAELDADTINQVLEEAGKFCAEVLFPLNQSGDLQGCTRHEDGSVTTPDGFKEAYRLYAESGWGTLAAPAEFGLRPTWLESRERSEPREGVGPRQLCWRGPETATFPR